jgi:ABC-type branched-subunit amino acid transport system ATPase component
VSNRAIRALADTHAFNARPRTQDQRQVYVPFGDLVEAPGVERRVTDLAAAGTRIGLVGRTGSGKSSLLEHVLTQHPFARISVPVSLDQDRVAREPRLFAQHLVHALSRYGEASARQEQNERIHAIAADRSEVQREPGLLHGEAAFEFAGSATRIEVNRPAAEIVQQAGRLFDLLRASALQPVLVVDDSDKWLGAATEPMIKDFFGRVLPWIAELGTGIVIALQPAHYLESRAYRDARRAGVPERELEMPVLREPVHLGRILAKRVEVTGVDEPFAGLFTETAVEVLFDYYAGEADCSLRKTLNAANCAVDLAAEGGAVVVDDTLMTAGIKER